MNESDFIDYLSLPVIECKTVDDYRLVVHTYSAAELEIESQNPDSMVRRVCDPFIVSNAITPTGTIVLREGDVIIVTLTHQYVSDPKRVRFRVDKVNL